MSGVRTEDGLALSTLAVRMHNVANRVPQELFAYNRNGLRMAIAALEDEMDELYEEWRLHKRALGNCVNEVRHELLDIAAVAMLAYEETFRGDYDEALQGSSGNLRSVP